MMDNRVWVILGFAVYGALCFLVFLKRLLFGDTRKKQMEKLRMEASKKEEELSEEIFKKVLDIAELEGVIADLKDKLAKLQAACEPLPDKFYGGDLAYDYRDVTIYVPDENFNKMVLGNPLFVAKSCRNRYDKDAVGLNYRGEELALLCRGKIQEMALDYLSRGDGGYAIISSIDDSEKTVKVHLGFYKGCDFPKDDE